MSRLIVLNGPPEVGKTTVARRYAQAHPPALCLDIDTVRGLIGSWRDDPAQAGVLARSLAVVMATAHLRAGHDVVVPQYLGRPGFLDELERLAGQTGSSFHEIVLLDTRENTLTRYHARAEDPDLRAHHDSTLAMAGGDDGLREMYDRLVALVANRPGATVLRTTAGDEDGTFDAVLVTLAGPPG